MRPSGGGSSLLVAFTARQASTEATRPRRASTAATAPPMMVHESIGTFQPRLPTLQPAFVSPKPNTCWQAHAAGAATTPTHIISSSERELFIAAGTPESARPLRP